MNYTQNQLSKNNYLTEEIWRQTSIKSLKTAHSSIHSWKKEERKEEEKKGGREGGREQGKQQDSKKPDEIAKQHSI